MEAIGKVPIFAIIWYTPGCAAGMENCVVRCPRRSVDVDVVSGEPRVPKDQLSSTIEFFGRFAPKTVTVREIDGPDVDESAM